MKKLNIFLAAILTLSLFSCINEIDDDKQGIIQPIEEEIIFRMQVPGHKKPITYAATERDENEIKEIDILAFAKQGSTSVDTLAYRIKVDMSSISDATDAVNGNKKDIAVRLQRNESDLKFVLIANARSFLDGISINNGDKLEDIFADLTYQFSGKWETEPMTAIPMWGQTSGYISIKNPSETKPVNITLLRSIAKIDVGVDVYGDPAIGFGTRFKLKHIYVYNANNKGYIVPDLSDTGLANNKVTKPHVPATANALSSYQEYAVTNTTFFNEIYLPESDKTSSTHSCLIIGGTYDGGAETFYRIDFVNNSSENLDLLRNYRYLVNITNVARDGFATKEEAAAARTSHIEYSLSVFNEDINSIVYNGQYGLGVSESKVTLGWDISTNNKITVATDYPGGFTTTSNDSWISITSAPTGVQNGTIVFTVTRNNEEALFRTGKITITAGSLVQDVEIRQSLGANSVLVTPGGTTQLFALFANADGRARVTSGMSLQTEVLWQDALGVIASASISGVGKEAIVSVNAGSAGNAIVAIKNGATILWSWHIWVTTYDPELNISQKSHKETIFMDRNLGASISTPNTEGALGLFYQWGRKDPFPGAISTTSNTPKEIFNGSGLGTEISSVKVSNAANFDNAIKNPMTFYYSAEYPWYSWYGLEETNNSLWVDTYGNKTAYDPCPQGWRVPTTPEVWEGTTTQGWSNGVTLSSAGYYPATGSIDFSTGKIIDVRSDGYYWTAGVSGPNAKAMRITASNVSILSTPLRASGCPVRCVKEY